MIVKPDNNHLKTEAKQAHLLMKSLFSDAVVAFSEKDACFQIKDAQLPYRKIYTISWEEVIERAKNNLLPILKSPKKNELHLVYQPHHKLAKTFDTLIKFYGKENPLAPLLSVNTIFKSDSSNKLLIISPDSLSKTYRKKELELVRFSNLHFSEVGFIKLPLFDLSDFLSYAQLNKYDLLIIPETKKSLLRNFLKSYEESQKALLQTNLLIYPDSEL